ncbi:HAMP domain-containing sensor histidine kinase [Paenibacillus agaridevorans]|nr:HAMP domain-containing sensor histidine kinase [Paenibacillus agaridevorans]
MGNVLRSFRFRMLLLFGLSMGFAAAITFAIYRVSQLYYYTTKIEDPSTKIRYFIRQVGDVNFFLIFFIPLAVWFFFLLTKRYARYFHDISGGIRSLAAGQFDAKVHIASTDEFGDIARDINLAGEKLMEAQERGDAAESSKEQLVLNLAHDLRTPLTSVIGYLDFILKNGDLPQAQIQHYAMIAYSKSQRLEHLIDELFEVTRMNYGKLDIVRNPMDLSELLHQMSEEFYPQLENRGLTARMDVAPSLVIQGDGELLARVFENLISNAVHYGGGGQFIDIHGRLEGEEVVVEITNYGDFIAPEDLPYIFDMFYTSDKARTYHEGSTGLGLFIARNIVKQHQGRITADSNVIRTKFQVRLPVGAEDAPAN